MANELPTYKTVKQFAETHPAFSIGGLRDLIFHADFNGLSKMSVIHRVGAKILIDEERFFDWIATNPSSTGMSTKGANNDK